MGYYGEPKLVKKGNTKKMELLDSLTDNYRISFIKLKDKKITFEISFDTNESTCVGNSVLYELEVECNFFDMFEYSQENKYDFKWGYIKNHVNMDLDSIKLYKTIMRRC